MNTSFPHLSTSLLRIAPYTKIIPARILPELTSFRFGSEIFKQFAHQKSFIGHKDPDSFTEFASITTLLSTSNYLFTGSSDKLIKIWDKNTGALQFSFINHSSKIVGILLFENIIVSACSNIITIWHLMSGNILISLSDLTYQIFTIQKIDEHKFLACSRSGKIEIFEINSENFEPFTWEAGTINAILISPNSAYVVTANDEGVRLWETETGSLACEYRTSAEVFLVKWCKFDDFFVTSSNKIEIWRFSETDVLNFSMNHHSPIKRKIFSMPGSGTFEFCMRTLIVSLEKDQNFEIIIYADERIVKKEPYPQKILVICALESHRVFAIGDTIGNIVIFELYSLEKLFKYKESGSMCMINGIDLQITHLIWSDLSLISGSRKGTHSFYGFGDRDPFITSPIQQFYSLDYLGNFTKSLTLCDFKLAAYKYQPEIPFFYKIKGYKNNPASHSQLFQYFKHQEIQVFNETQAFDDNFELILSENSEENDQISDDRSSQLSIKSMIEVNTDVYCARCRKIMMDDTIWCNKCGRIFHLSCFESWKFVMEDEICLLCFKSSQKFTDIKQAKKNFVLGLPVSEKLVQVGDTVVFILQAYEMYLKLSPFVPLLDSELLRFIEPTAFKVTFIEYVWPFQGPFELVSSHVCMKIYLTLLGDTSTFSVYYIHAHEPFLILHEEYLQKLYEFQQKIKHKSVITDKNEEKIIDISPIDKYLPNSPWKNIILDDSRMSFWEIQVPVSFSVIQTPFISLSKYTKCTLFIYFPADKHYKAKIAMPMYLQLIESRLCSKYYRTLAAVNFDIDLILANTEEVYGKKSKEYKDFTKIVNSLKEEVAKNTSKLCRSVEIDIEEGFRAYLPHNMKEFPIAVMEIFEGNRKKLRKIN